MVNHLFLRERKNALFATLMYIFVILDLVLQNNPT